MNGQSIRAILRRFREELECYGIAALERFDWTGDFSRLGFEIDCERLYEEAYGLSLGNARDIGREFSRVDNTAVLDNAIFSQCRYLTHWPGGYGKENVARLVAVLKHSEELRFLESAQHSRRSPLQGVAKETARSLF